MDILWISLFWWKKEKPELNNDKAQDPAWEIIATLDFSKVSEKQLEKYKLTISRYILDWISAWFMVNKLLPIPLANWMPLDKDWNKLEWAVWFDIIEKYFKEEFVDEKTGQQKYEIVKYENRIVKNNVIAVMVIKRLK